MKLSCRRARRGPRLWWNWDKHRDNKTIYLLALHLIVKGDKEQAGLVLTVWQWQVAVTWFSRTTP